MSLKRKLNASQGPAQKIKQTGTIKKVTGKTNPASNQSIAKPPRQN